MSYTFPTHERYEAVEVLGQGGMGVVFRARDRHLDRDVALKVMRSPDATGVAQLTAEFRARSVLHHPNLLPLLDLEVGPRHAFFTMDLVEGVDLATWFRADEPSAFVTTLGLGDTLRAVATQAMQSRAIEGPPTARLGDLARVACQLIEALDALHRAGLVHRDVKPQNVLVDGDGMVRLADFGLATTFRAAHGEPSQQPEIAGTPGFMAPELLRGGRATPQSDGFALGATLFHVLVGRPPAVGELAANALPDGNLEPWTGLIDELLANTPDARPELNECHARLGAMSEHDPGAIDDHVAWLRIEGGPVVGRTEELAWLERRAHEARNAPKTVIAHVTGPSGIGKTRLVEELLRTLDDRTLTVLRGRCHPREHVAFAGFDSIVDGLVAHIESHSHLLQSIDDTAAGALQRVFPAFERLGRVGAASRGTEDESKRRMAFATLRRLIERVAREQPVVLWLEDLHWIAGDAEELLGALLRQGGPARVFMVVTYRPADVSDEQGALAAMGGHRLSLAPLSDEDTKAMLEELSGMEVSAEVVGATTGHPILIREVARHLRAAPGLMDGDEMLLPRLINESVNRLHAAERDVIDMLALSPWPLPSSVALRALRDDAKPSVLVSLQQMGFARSVGSHQRVAILPYHDQIRFARRQLMDRERQASLHKALARAYERDSGPAPHEQLAHHYYEAGDATRAGVSARAAAEAANAQLAFRKAATYFERARQWLPGGDDDRDLIASLASARAKAGLAAASGNAYERAARLTSGSARATLLSRAAEQFLHGAHVLDGYRLLREAFEPYGVRLPQSHYAALLMSLGWRARVISSDPFALDDALGDDEDAALEQKLDALWTATNGLIHINHALADVMLLMHTADARRRPDASRLIRSLTLEAGAEATLGGRFFNWRADRLLAQAQRLLDQRPTPFDRGWLAVGRGAVASFRGKWAEAARWSADADALLQSHALGATFERSVNFIYYLVALAHLGRMDDLEAQQAIAEEDARERGDDFALNISRSGHTALLWLARDDTRTAREHAANLFQIERLGMSRPRPWPEGTFRTPDYHNLIAVTHLDLYEGHARRAHDRICYQWPRIGEAMLLRVQFVGADLFYLRGKSAIAAGRPTDAAKMAHALQRDGHAVGRVYAATLRAALASSPRQAMRAAADRFDALGMCWHAASARRHAHGSGAELARQGVRDPERFARVLVPTSPSRQP